MSRGFVAYLQAPVGRKKRQPDLNAQRAAMTKFAMEQEGELLAEYARSTSWRWIFPSLTIGLCRFSPPSPGASPWRPHATTFRGSRREA